MHTSVEFALTYITTWSMNTSACCFLSLLAGDGLDVQDLKGLVRVDSASEDQVSESCEGPPAVYQAVSCFISEQPATVTVTVVCVVV